MNQSCWKINEAKAHFSNVLTASAKAPQIIYNRNEPVAVVMHYQEFIASRQNQASVVDMIHEILEISQKNPLELSLPSRSNRQEVDF